MKLSKEHIKALPDIKVQTDVPRESELVSLSIPIFKSERGLGANFDENKRFDEELFKSTVLKGAAWAAQSIIANTDLCENGMPIYFHVEDVVYDMTQQILGRFGIPEEWIRKTSFPDPEHKMDHWLTGKKLYHLCDATDESLIKVIWDSDVFVYRKFNSDKLKWYGKFDKHLTDKILVSFYSEDNGGDTSFSNWQLRGIGLPEVDNSHPASKSLEHVYEKAQLPFRNQQFRWGASILSVPSDHEIIDFIRPHIHESRSDEALLTIYMNSVKTDFIELESLFNISFLNFDVDFEKHDKDCIAHMRGVDIKSVQNYKSKFVNGISRIKMANPVQKQNSDVDYRVHIISVPHNPSHPDYSCCAFAQKARKLALMVNYIGRECFHYGNELSDVECAEHISVTTEKEMIESYGDFRTQSDVYRFNENDYVYKMFNIRTEHELRKRAKPNDIICYVFAPYQKRLYYRLQDLKKVYHVESGIGYFESFMPFRVFESPGLQAYHYGMFGEKNASYWFLSEEEREKYAHDPHTHFNYADIPKADVVIPNSFDVNQFDFRVKKDDYFLYLGRINRYKGIEEAMRIAHALGKKLIIAGQGDFEKEHGFKPYANVEIIGRADVETRRDLISRASALFCMSRYWEAFGGVHIEAMLSGTPPIATDKGGYVHTIRSGYNGYRVNMNLYEQGLWCAKNLDKISPYNLRDFGLRFSNEQIALRYDEYFSSLIRMMNNDGNPYWLEHAGRESLDWLDYDRKIKWPKEWMTPVDISEKGENKCSEDV